MSIRVLRRIFCLFTAVICLTVPVLGYAANETNLFSEETLVENETDEVLTEEETEELMRESETEETLVENETEEIPAENEAEETEQEIQEGDINNILSFAVDANEAVPLDGEMYYQGYHENITLSNGEIKGGLRTKDGDGEDNIAYCYDLEKAYPKSEDTWDGSKTWYTRIENYMESTDPFIEKYGVDKKVKIAAALFAGYPHDGYGLRERYNISDNDARYVTQIIVWAITKGADYYLDAKEFNDQMRRYCEDIYQYVKKASEVSDHFQQGSLEIYGDFKFEKTDEGWETGSIFLKGEKGEIEFVELPAGVKVFDDYTNMEITGNLQVGRTFYLKSDNYPGEDIRIVLKYKYKMVKFFFYKTVSEADVNVQNLIRIEPTENEIDSYFLYKDETFEEIEKPDPGYELPDTGGEGVDLYILGGLLIIFEVLVFAYVFWYRQGRRRR